MLGAQVALPADVQADLVDAPAGDQRLGQIGRAVGDDRNPTGRAGGAGVLGSAHGPRSLRAALRQRVGAASADDGIHPGGPDRLAQRADRIVAGAPSELLAGLGRAHDHGLPQGGDPLRLRRQEAQAGDHLGDRIDGQLGHGDRVPAELLGQCPDGQLAGAGEVVDAGAAPSQDASADRRGDVVVVDELEGHPGVGQHWPEDRHAVEQAQHGTGKPLGDLGVGQAVDQQRRLRPGDDAGPEHVGRRGGPVQRVRQQLLDLGLLRRVVVRGGAARGDVLGERLRVVAVKAVGGHRGGVDEPLHAGCRGSLEDVAGAVQVDPAAGLGAAHDHEGEVDDDIGLLDQA